MKTAALFLITALATVGRCQTYTLSGCHRHSNIEYCFLPDGTETPWTTYAASSEPTPTAAGEPSTSAAEVTAAPTAVTGCHMHTDTQFCMVGQAEYEVLTDVDPESAPDSYNGCHAHGEELHCTGGDTEVTLAPMAAASSEEGHEGHGHEHSESAANTEGISCHDHAGVEHCVDAQGNTVETGCSAPSRDYDIPIRIGLLFVILVTSCLGVFAPILTARFTSFEMDHLVLLAMRQFGTGIIISTAVIHLFTHAQIFFANECLGRLEYEATAGAILMAGFFLTFLIEYIAHRHSHRKTLEARQSISPVSDTKDAEAAQAETPASASTLNTTVMEAGIIFHSILIGLTLVVASDSGFITLFIVILFHQVFEGFALGARIAGIPNSLIHKLIMGLAFGVTTPIGMGIGIGVLSSFNGNDPSTIVAIGTLNAFSAGILTWVGVVEMWYVEWFNGPLAHAGLFKTCVCMFSLVCGLILMSVLGKWA